MNMKILHDPACDALLAQHSNFVPIDIGEVLVRCMNERRGRKKFSHREKLEGVDWAFSQMGDNKLLMAEGVGFAPPPFERRSPENCSFGRPNLLGPQAPSICRKIENLNGDALQLGTRTDKTPSPVVENVVPAVPHTGSTQRARAIVNVMRGKPRHE
jgi:hypothetical protein